MSEDSSVTWSIRWLREDRDEFDVTNRVDLPLIADVIKRQIKVAEVFDDPVDKVVDRKSVV